MNFAEDKAWLKAFTLIKNEIQNPDMAYYAPANKDKLMSIYK